MKKLIGTAMLAALLATSAFAELSISGGATQLWSPIAYNGGDVMTGSQCPWGGGRTGSVGFTWVSDDGKAGTSLAFIYNPWDYAKWTFDDENKGAAKKNEPTAYGDGAAYSLANADGTRVIWVKPWDFLKLSLGHWDGINDISAVNTASWDWLRPGNWIAQLYSENQATGALLEITPIDNLMVRVGLPFTNPEIAYHMFEGIAADVEYTIEDLLGIKVGWRGGRNSHSTMTPSIYKNDSDFLNVGEVNVFLSLLAVENLQLDLGARVNILSGDYAEGYDLKPTTKYEDAEKYAGTSAIIGLKAGYNITDNFSVKADFAVQTYKKAKVNGTEVGSHKPDFAFGVGVGYGLTDSLELVADFRGLIKGDAESKADDKTYSSDPTFSFLVGMNYTCSTNASIGIGFQGKTNGGNIGPLAARSSNFGFAVPIRVNVSF